jgi:pyruvate dehydrogenase E2 component (dihydrolipoamide acetyltransferase)
VRRTIAQKMARSHREIPRASTWVDVDATALWTLREEMNRAQADVKVSPLALILRCCVVALGELPVLNARLDAEREEIVLQPAIHLGVAAQTERGLLVPVIKDAQARTTLQLAAELNRLSTAARAGTLTPAELTGGSFSVSNYGVFGVDGGSPIVNHPEVAILGVGRIFDRPWVHQGALAIRTVVQLSLSFDHRVCDGGEAGGFLRRVADLVESPARLLGAV